MDPQLQRPMPVIGTAADGRSDRSPRTTTSPDLAVAAPPGEVAKAGSTQTVAGRPAVVSRRLPESTIFPAFASSQVRAHAEDMRQGSRIAISSLIAPAFPQFLMKAENRGGLFREMIPRSHAIFRRAAGVNPLRGRAGISREMSRHAAPRQFGR